MEISFGEMLLICLIAFVVLGPTELVKRAHQLGRWVAKLRTEMENFKVMAKEQMMLQEVVKVQDDLNKQVPLDIGTQAKVIPDSVSNNFVEKKNDDSGVS